jgi:hypothetical protein
MKPIYLVRFRGDAARHRRAIVKSGRRTTTAAIFLRIGPSEHALQHGCGIIASPGVSIRTSFLPVLIAPKILHGSEPRCDDMVRYMEWASEELPRCAASAD